MEDKEMKEFSRTAFFLVTGFSFIVFSKVLRFLNRAPLPIFTWIGVIAIMIGSLYFIATLKGKSEQN
ncbi:MAG TPA: hypothetical protein VK483_00275 [Chitinophagaceae bacterium]|nr:hypothetical protein [Chitinophagaceae bacterium]